MDCVIIGLHLRRDRGNYVFGLTVDTALFNFLAGKCVESISQVGETTMVLIDFGSATLNVECVWRVRDTDRLVITSEDEKHPERDWSKDPITEVQRVLVGKSVSLVYFLMETEDLFIQFEDDVWLDVLSDSTMFESWQIDAGEYGYFVAKG